jgi:hypothetical protein
VSEKQRGKKKEWPGHHLLWIFLLLYASCVNYSCNHRGVSAEIERKGEGEGKGKGKGVSKETEAEAERERLLRRPFFCTHNTHRRIQLEITVILQWTEKREKKKGRKGRKEKQ